MNKKYCIIGIKDSGDMKVLDNFAYKGFAKDIIEERLKEGSPIYKAFIISRYYY